ncbi:MAG: hypothetical protein AAGI11_18110 [Pseudomonadota bacterium]
MALELKLKAPNLQHPVIMAAALALAACATPPPEPVVQPTAPEDVELTLNLPQDDCNCNIEEAPQQDHTFLERGVHALSAGEYIEAIQYFQRFQRLEKSAQADWEAGVSIAYASTLPNSPFYDPEAAERRYRRLSKQPTDDMAIHPYVLLMRESLESFMVMNRHVVDLENSNAILKEDLAKREEALRRLRELTLGQKGSPP